MLPYIQWVWQWHCNGLETLLTLNQQCLAVKYNTACTLVSNITTVL